MSDEVKVLERLLENGSLDDQDARVRGIAQLAVDNGFETLTDPQKNVLWPHLAMTCEGVTDPGGHHKDCQADLEGAELVAALTAQAWNGSLLCEQCTDEKEQYAREWDRIDRE